MSLLPLCPFPRFVLFHPRFHKLPYERDRKFLVQRKVDGRFGGLIRCQLVFVFLDCWRPQVESDMLLHETEPSYPPLVVTGHSVTYAFFGGRRGLPDDRPEFFQLASRFFGHGRKVFVNAFWFLHDYQSLQRDTQARKSYDKHTPHRRYQSDGEPAASLCDTACGLAEQDPVPSAFADLPFVETSFGAQLHFIHGLGHRFLQSPGFRLSTRYISRSFPAAEVYLNIRLNGVPLGDLNERFADVQTGGPGATSNTSAPVGICSATAAIDWRHQAHFPVCACFTGWSCVWDRIVNAVYL